MANTTERATTVEAFSFNGELGQAAGGIKPTLNVPRLSVPTRIIAKNFKENSDNTAIIRFNENWAVSLRLHNASSRVESSLKLDVRLINVPAALLKIVERW